jgi:hypothetical protein
MRSGRIDVSNNQVCNSIEKVHLFNRMYEEIESFFEILKKVLVLSLNYS